MPAIEPIIRSEGFYPTFPSVVVPPPSPSTWGGIEGGRGHEALTGTLRTAGSPTSSLASTLVQTFDQALAKVERTEEEARTQTQALLTGGNVELHNVMLALERAGIQLQYVMQVRNRLLEVYQELMRMPM